MPIIFKTSPYQTQNPELFVEDLTRILVTTSGEYLEDEDTKIGQSWNLGTSNNWWLHLGLDGEGVWTLNYRYETLERMKMVAEFLDWRLTLSDIVVSK